MRLTPDMQDVFVDEVDAENKPIVIRFLPNGSMAQIKFRRNVSCGDAYNCLHVGSVEYNYRDHPGSLYVVPKGVMNRAQMIALRDLLNLAIDEGMDAYYRKDTVE